MCTVQESIDFLAINGNSPVDVVCIAVTRSIIVMGRKYGCKPSGYGSEKGCQRPSVRFFDAFQAFMKEIHLINRKKGRVLWTTMTCPMKSFALC